MTNTLRRIAAVIAVPAALTFALTACGGEAGSGRPSTAALVKALSSGKVASDMGTDGLSAPQLTCFAQKIHDSKLSDDALRAIVNDDENFDGKSGDKAALSDLEKDAASCATAK